MIDRSCGVRMVFEENAPTTSHVYRIFISSSGDLVERERARNVISRLNGEFADLARLVPVFFEDQHYQAHDTFQRQIKSPTDCDIVIAILKWRIGTRLPNSFQRMPNGEPYPSGTAYEILAAVEQRQKGAQLPDVYVFRYESLGPSAAADDPRLEEILEQWVALKSFVARWFFSREDGFKAAFNSYKSEDDFEAQLETLLRKWLADKVADGRVIRWPATKGSPFRGLSVFGARHAPVFFGRAVDIRRSIDNWREAAARGTPFLLVVGASGAGKSSLARAGLLPRLTTPGVVTAVDIWRSCVFRPGDSPNGPFTSLAGALLAHEVDLRPEDEGSGPALPEIADGDCKTVSALAEVLAHADAGAVRVILNAIDRLDARAKSAGRYHRDPLCELVLLVDQLDEIFAPSVPAQTREAFARLLAKLAATGRIWIVASLRADLYQEALGVESLKRLKDAGATYDLTPPGHAELAEIVRAPAVAAGLVFDADPVTGDRLDERILREADRPDMLPLVQLALSRLWEAREVRPDGAAVLPLRAYDRLGGLSGIIDEAGETTLQNLGKPEQAQLPRLIRSLAEISDVAGGGVISRAVPLDEAAPDGDSLRLVNALVEQRLLTKVGDAEGAFLRLTHQRVLTDWTRVAKIVQESSDFYRVRDEIERQCRRWSHVKASGKSTGGLLLADGLPLAGARAMVDKYRTELPSEIVLFVEASRRRAARAQVWVRTVAVVFALVASGAGFAAWIAFEKSVEARHQQAIADQNYQAARDALVQVSADVANSFEGNKSINNLVLTLLPTIQQSVDRLGVAAAGDPQMRLSRVAILYNFAHAYALTGQWDKAREAALESVGLARALRSENKNDTHIQLELVRALDNLGYIDHIYFEGSAALDELHESEEIMTPLFAEQPNNPEVADLLLRTLDFLAEALDQENYAPAASTVRQRAADVRKKLKP